MFGPRLPTLLLCISMDRDFLKDIYFPSETFFRDICCFMVFNALNILIFFFDICCKSLHLKNAFYRTIRYLVKNSVQFYIGMDLLDQSSFNAVLAIAAFLLTNKRFRRRQIFRCINDEVATFISFDRNIKW